MSRTIVIPARSKHIASVIFLHGLGDSGAGWSFLPELLAVQALLQGVKWILPSAPSAPVTANGGMRMPSWYDIKSIGDINQMEDEEGMLKSVRIVHDLVDGEIAGGLQASQIIVAGFSQGCAMSLLSGLSYTKRLGAIVGLSGYLPLRQKLASYASEANRTCPVWLGHGTADPVVSFKYGKMTAETLRAHGLDVSWNEYPGMGHTADPKEIDHLAKFIQNVLDRGQ